MTKQNMLVAFTPYTAYLTPTFSEETSQLFPQWAINNLNATTLDGDATEVEELEEQNNQTNGQERLQNEIQKITQKIKQEIEQAEQKIE